MKFEEDAKPEPQSGHCRGRLASRISVASLGEAGAWRKAKDPKIGLVAFVAVGMAEISSCQITVQEGQPVQRGEQLGMFHFGGSTHCLVFRPGVSLDFQIKVTDKPNLDATNVAVKSNLAKVG